MMISIRAVINIFVATVFLGVISGCGAPFPQGKLLINPNSVTPVQSLKVVFVFPKPSNWKDEEGERVREALERRGYFDGDYEKQLVQEFKANFAANKIDAEITFSDKPLLPQVDYNLSGGKFTHLLVLNATGFSVSNRSDTGVSGDALLVDGQTKQSIWKSTFSLFVARDDLYKKDTDLVFLKMMNSWVENGIVRLNTKTAITAQGKSKVTIMGILL